MKRSTVVLFSLAVAGAAVGAWRWLQPPPPTEVVVAKAERVALLRSLVSATGEIKAKEFVDIQTEVAGVIIDLLVQEGDEVQQGQVLLKLDALGDDGLRDRLAGGVALRADESAALAALLSQLDQDLRDELTLKTERCTQLATASRKVVDDSLGAVFID